MLTWALVSAFIIPHSALTVARPPLPVETIRSVAALPAHIAGSFRDIAACHLTPEGDYLVFDRGAHSTSLVTRQGAAREIVQIGVEPGKLLRPLAFDSAPDGTFVIADAPYRTERVQSFFYRGGAVGGFTLPGRTTPRIALGNYVLSGVGSLDYTGKTVLVSQPESGALVTEYGLDGRVLRSFGTLRRTGHEDERDLHLALNAGIPIWLGATEGFYFVFLGGIPSVRKYGPDGTMIFERHVEGVEIDSHIQALPGTWPKRTTEAGLIPIVPPTIRAAAVDPSGNLWLSLVSGHTYVYDPQGDKRRIIQFEAAGAISVGNFHFTSDGRLLTAPGCYSFKVSR